MAGMVAMAELLVYITFIVYRKILDSVVRLCLRELKVKSDFHQLSFFFYFEVKLAGS